MDENLNIIYGESADLKDFFERLFDQDWDIKKQQKKAERAHPADKLESGNTLSQLNSSMRVFLIGNTYRDAYQAHEANCLSDLRNQLISQSLNALGVLVTGDDHILLKRIPAEFWITAETSVANNSASNASLSFERIRIVSNRYEKTMTASEHIIEAIRHEKRLHEASKPTQWWGVKRKKRIDNCRAFIKNNFGINTLKDEGYSDRHFDKFFTKFRSGTMT